MAGRENEKKYSAKKSYKEIYQERSFIQIFSESRPHQNEKQCCKHATPQCTDWNIRNGTPAKP